MFRAKSQAQRLVGVSPRRTQGGHHLNSAIDEFIGIETSAPMVSPQIESREKRVQ